MKTNTTKNLASAAMLAILSPVLALGILVSIKSAGIVGNEVLLLLLTLSAAVLSGINGFGRRTAQLAPLSSAKIRSARAQSGQSVHWSPRPSTNA
jgi:hypothetical protein